MDTSLKLAAGAAAALAIAILGSTVLTPEPAPTVGGPGPTPSATSTPTPSSSGAPALFRTGQLAAGTYTTDAAFPIGITFTVPDGWSGLASGPTVKVLESDADAKVVAYVSFWIVQTASRNPCGLSGGDDAPVGPTADDLAEALVGAPGFETSGPTTEIVDGLEGQYVELTGPQAGCIEPELWTTPDGSCRCMDNRFERNRLWILEVDGSRLVIDASLVPTSGDEEGTSPAEIGELEAIIDSIEIAR
jgi:hypothetical protein